MTARDEHIAETLRPAWRFRGTFRTYQQRVLDAADAYLDDNHLHVVAAPGSGKTILGLEIAGRLGQPVLAFSPTLTVRDQWLSRLKENFELAPSLRAEDFSTNLRAPGFFTSTSYQALFAAVADVASGRGSDDEEAQDRDPDPNDIQVTAPDAASESERTADAPATGQEDAPADEGGHEESSNAPMDRAAERAAVAALARTLSDVGTLILDEAHHLRTQWHRVLTELVVQLRAANPGLRVVALTATPPYDSSLAEWNRYIDLCGEIDEEISVPELVATGDLAPHQDFVYVGSPTKEESSTIKAVRARITDAVAEMAAPATLLQAGANPIMTAPEAALDECFDDEDGLAGFLLLLDLWHVPRPDPINALFARGGRGGSYSSGVRFILKHEGLFDPAFTSAVRDILERRRLLNRGELVDPSDEVAQKILATSLGKLAATTTIVAHEAVALGPDARILVLFDHIQADQLSSVGTTNPFTKIGVVPGFESLRRELASRPELEGLARTQRIAVLTGSLVLVPSDALDRLSGIAEEQSAHFSATTLPTCPAYARLSFPGGTAVAVQVLTRAFADGVLTIVYGTAALLGEGWDMPQLNTLVLASSIKATMMANQMRGRVIRTDPGAPQKVANIWHITCAEHSKTFSFVDSIGIARLAGRMRTFVGPRATEPIIQNGMERCAADEGEWAQLGPGRLNEDNLRRSGDRALTRRLWQEALAQQRVSGAEGFRPRVESELRMPKPTRVVSPFDYILGAVLLVLVVALGYVAEAFEYRGIPVRSLVPILVVMGVLVVSIAGVLAVHRRTRNTLLNANWRVTAQAGALLETLATMGLVRSPTASILVSESAVPGVITVSLEGAKPREQQLFSNAISEMCAPVKNPRYVLTPVRGVRVGKVLMAMSVPQVIGTRQDQVETLVGALSKRGLHMKAHYTRNHEGRELLLEARKFALDNIATGFSRVYTLLGA